MKNILTWFNSIEQSIFGDKIESNVYFSTISIMFAALTGAMLGGGDILYSWDIISDKMNPTATYSFLVILASLNIAESIMAAKTVGTGFFRTLLVTVAIPLAAAIGYAVAVIVFIIILLWLILLGFSVALGGGSGSGKKRGILSDGTEVEETGSGLLGEKYYKSTDGSRKFQGQSGSDHVTEL